MKKIYKRVKIIALALALLELILLGLFAGFYFGDWAGFRTSLDPVYYVAIALSIATINIIFIWVVFIIISATRQKTDLHAAEVIGSDVQEAYNFAQIGLVVTDENDMVLWTNDLFRDRHIDIIDNNICEWNHDLKEFKEANNPSSLCKTIILGRNYDVKYLPEAGLWIFKDSFEYESLYKRYEDESIVVGLLSIDNYSEVVRDEEDYNDTVSKVKNEIFDYAKEFEILLRRYKDENYYLLCTNDALERMKKDNFSLLDKVRRLSMNEDIPLTLSIGIGYNFRDVIRLNELAEESLNLAMTRGGDQVVISPYGQDRIFIGGKTEAQEKRNRVRVRVQADSLISLIKSSSNAIIMGHTDMDMDALGSCLGIEAICNRLSIPAHIAVDMKHTESKTRSAINSMFSKEELDEYFVSEKRVEDSIKPNTILIVCDVHIPSLVMFPELLEKISKIVVIDHHRRAEESIEKPALSYIDPAASSASELVTELIRFSSINPKVELPNNFATIMLAGIFLDSSYYKSKNTGIRTFEASTILKEYGADNSLADDLLKDDYEDYLEIYQILDHLKAIEYGAYYAMGSEDKIYDSSTIAKAANTALAMKGVHASFIFGKVSAKEVRLSLRSDGMLNVQYIAEKLGGGGHFASAAVTFEKSDLKVVEEIVINAISTYYKDAKSDERVIEGE